MKSLKNSIYGILTAGLLFTANTSVAQMVGASAYLQGLHAQVGVNANGYEGAPNIPGSHARSSAWTSAAIWFGFVANPQLDGWGNYDGDFFTPGSPENGFGLRIGGVDYSNNSTGWPGPQIIGGVTGYSEDGDCMMADWDGSVAGVDMHIQYKMIKTELYYTTTVSLTNTTGAAMTDVYYYRNFDPDNNQPIGWGFMTQNTIQAQPNPSCEIALVSAEQSSMWDNYVGLGAIGSNFRVTYGGFSNRNAYNIWNGIAPFVQTTGATTYCDCAISLAYKIANLPAGATEEFQFTVVMSSSDVDAAIASLYHFDYDGGTGSIDVCNPVTDTVDICPGTSTEITVDGPSASDYTWSWSPPTGLSTTVGPTTEASPSSTTTYTVTGTPTSSCLATEISKDIVVRMLAPPAGPDVTDDACNSGDVLDLNAYLIPEALAGGGSWEETSSPASGSFDAGTGSFDATGLTAGDYTFDYIVVTLPPCPQDTATITISVHQQVEAGDDNTAQICNNPGSTIDLNTLLSSDAYAGGTWSETVATGGFDGVSVLDGTGVTPSTYGYTYTVAGVAPCPSDDASFTVTVLPPPPVEANASDPDGVIEGCEDQFITLTGSGAGPGGTYVWDNSVFDGLPFVQAPGTVTYTVTGTDANGCWATDPVDVLIHPKPAITIVADTTIGCTPFAVHFTGSSDPASSSCNWSFGDGNGSTACGEVFNQYNFEGVYDVTLEVVSIHGCVNSETYEDYITVANMPEPAFTFSPWRPVVNETEVEFTNNSLYATGYTWDFGDGTALSSEENPAHEFPPTVGNIDYYVTLTATNELGCTSTAQQIVHVDDIIIFYIPNIFTPDGDEYNQTFKPVFYSGIDPYDFHLTIWNRYGEIVFETYNPQVGWDGTYGSQGLVQDGTYIWQLDFKETMSDKRHKHHGHVTILK